MGILYVVATPIGNLGDISLRAIEILKNVDIIAVEDTRQTIKLLNHFEIKNKMLAYHKFNEKEKSDYLIEKLKTGVNIALVTDAGTPCISDPGYILVNKAHYNNIEVITIPGASAVIAALSISGLNTDKFTFIGFLSRDNTKLNNELEEIENSKINTFIIYESPKRIVKLIAKLKNKFPNSLIAICSELTKLHERILMGNIEDVYESILTDPNIEKGEYVIILEKQSKQAAIATEFSIEAQLVNVIVTCKCSVKEAVKILSLNNKQLKKNDIYTASLNLKTIFNTNE